MSLKHIRHHKTFRFIAFVLIFQFLTVQIPVSQAEVQYQEDSGSYQPEKPADGSVFTYLFSFLKFITLSVAQV